MNIREIKSQVLQQLAFEHRIIVADWRLALTLEKLSLSRADEPTLKIIKSLLKSREIEAIDGVHGVYRVASLYGQYLKSSDMDILMEANPWVVFSHLSALFFHGVTDTIPREIYVTYNEERKTMNPIGTTPEDWKKADKPPFRKPKKINETVVDWSFIKSSWDFGYGIEFQGGSAIYVTDLERTMIDSLRKPHKFGGMVEIIKAWNNAIYMLDLDKLISYVERFKSPIVKQRVGYLLTEYKIDHISFRKWKNDSVRGSSSKLLADSPFNPNYSGEWNISINIPKSTLNLIEPKE